MKEVKFPSVGSDLNTISKRLKYLIDQAGVKQAHIARKLGVSRGAIYHILNSDDKNPKGVDKIATLLGIDSDWLHTGRLPSKESEQKSNFIVSKGKDPIPVYLLDQLLMLRQHVEENIEPLSHVYPQRQYSQKLFAVQLSMPSILQKFETGDIVVFAEKKSVKVGDWVLAYSSEEGRLVLGVVTFQESSQLVILYHKVESPLILKSSADSMVLGVFVESMKYARVFNN